jgi:hypothetical protein
MHPAIKLLFGKKSFLKKLNQIGNPGACYIKLLTAVL